MAQDISIAGLVLAAGRSKRMKSLLPKVLHDVGGKPMLEHVLDTLSNTQVEHLTVVLNKSTEPYKKIWSKYPKKQVCIQKNQNGTGGAVAATSHCFEGVSELEYYLTDCINLASKRGKPGTMFLSNKYSAFLGVNNQDQLKKMNYYMKSTGRDLCVE